VKGQMPAVGSYSLFPEWPALGAASRTLSVAITLSAAPWHSSSLLAALPPVESIAGAKLLRDVAFIPPQDIENRPRCHIAGPLGGIPSVASIWMFASFQTIV